MIQDRPTRRAQPIATGRSPLDDLRQPGARARQIEVCPEQVASDPIELPIAAAVVPQVADQALEVWNVFAPHVPRADPEVPVDLSLPPGRPESDLLNEPVDRG